MSSQPYETTATTIAIVLAGGASSRLGGRDKTRVPVAGATTLERVLRSTAADRRIDAVNLLTVAGISAVEPDAESDAALATTDKGYEGVAKDMDVVGFLSALLDEIGAPA